MVSGRQSAARSRCAERPSPMSVSFTKFVTRLQSVLTARLRNIDLDKNRDKARLICYNYPLLRSAIWPSRILRHSFVVNCILATFNSHVLPCPVENIDGFCLVEVSDGGIGFQGLTDAATGARLLDTARRIRMKTRRDRRAGGVQPRFEAHNFLMVRSTHLYRCRFSWFRGVLWPRTSRASCNVARMPDISWAHRAR